MRYCERSFANKSFQSEKEVEGASRDLHLVRCDYEHVRFLYTSRLRSWSSRAPRCPCLPIRSPQAPRAALWRRSFCIVFKLRPLVSVTRKRTNRSTATQMMANAKNSGRLPKHFT